MKIPIAALILLAACLFGPKPARAQVTLTLLPPEVSLEPGDTGTLRAELRNEGASEVFLNSTFLNLNAQGVIVNERPFLDNAPLSLLAGESWRGDAIEVSTDPSALPGQYTGVFSILGGDDEQARDQLTRGEFAVLISPPNSVPEVGGLGLALGMGAATVALIAFKQTPRLRKRRTR